MSELLKINVNEHTEKKGKLTYLSWAWAWAEVLKIDPSATWYASEYGPEGAQVPFMDIHGTAMVRTTVVLKGIQRSCLLPVMNHLNKAIVNPDAMAVNTAIMRCLAKNIAMHGLGLYIYAGEDLPEQDEDKNGDGGGTDHPALQGFRDAAMSGTESLRKHKDLNKPDAAFWARYSKELKDAAAAADKAPA